MLILNTTQSSQCSHPICCQEQNINYEWHFFPFIHCFANPAEVSLNTFVPLLGKDPCAQQIVSLVLLPSW